MRKTCKKIDLNNIKLNINMIRGLCHVHKL